MNLTEQDRLHLRIADDMRRLEQSELWAYLTDKIRSLKDGATGSVLAGVDHDTYRTKIGFIAALSDVERLAGELYEAEHEAKEKLTHAT